MNVLHPRCCGICEHKSFVIACFSIREGEQQHKEMRRFGIMSRDLIALRNWLLKSGCSHIGIESTGIYWRRVCSHLQGFFKIVVTNTQHMKGVPEHKTDVQEAEWIADLLQQGELPSSFVLGPEQQDLRDLMRPCISLVKERACLINCIHKILQEPNVKLSSVQSSIMSILERAILHTLTESEEDPKWLAYLSAQRKHDLLAQAVKGKMRPRHRFLLRELLSLIEAQDRSIAHMEQETDERLLSYEEPLSHLEVITAVSRRNHRLSKQRDAKRTTVAVEHGSLVIFIT